MVAILVSAAPKTRANDCTEAVPVSKPCSGLLIPFPDAESCLKTKMSLAEALEREQILAQIHMVELAEVGAKLETEQKRANALSALLDKNLNPPSPAFYETVWFGIAVGVVGTVTMAFLVHEVVK